MPGSPRLTGVGSAGDAEVSRRWVLRALLGATALAGLPTLTGCGSSSSSSSSSTSSPSTSAPHAVSPIAVGALPVEFHRVAAGVDANWTASPLSLAVAFGMLRAGARGATATAIDTVFGFPATSAPQGAAHQQLHAELAAVLATSASKAGDPTPPVLSIANGLWVDASFARSLRHDFSTLLSSYYGAAPQQVRFDDGSAARTINGWVSTQTHGKITKLFDTLDPTTRLVLADAVYLKAAWLYQFAPALTKPGTFTTARGRRVSTPLMYQSFEALGYRAGAGWQRVTLPYVGGALTMRIVLPTAVASSVAGLAPALTAAVAAAPGDPLEIVELTLPRWKTETAVDLIPPLTALGLGAVFGPGADLSGIAPGGLFVQQAVQRAVISVDENGTEAAAVTGLSIAESARPGTPVSVVVDRPFAWAIVHEPTGAVLFAGHVVDPTAG